MKLVIADTGPINYLILIEQVEILPRLFEKIVLPTTVEAELSDSHAPQSVRNWISGPPRWLEIVAAPVLSPPTGLHRGEAAAIDLAVALSADLLLIDDREGVQAARRRGLNVTGTLGILDLAAARGLIDFERAVKRLRLTTFRFPEAILNALLEKHRGDS